MFTKEFLDSHFIYNRLTGDFIRRSTGEVCNTGCGAGYIRLAIGNNRIRAHRAAIIMHYNITPKIVDHINGCRHDNRISNLSITSDVGNARNCSISKNNTSGINGVSLHKHSGLWHAIIYNKRKKISIGYFKDLECAAIARGLFEKILYYSHRHGK